MQDNERISYPDTAEPLSSIINPASLDTLKFKKNNICGFLQK